MRVRPLRPVRFVACLTLGAGLAANGSIAAQPGAADATRIGRSAVPKAPEFQELYDFDEPAKALAEATFPYESRLHRVSVLALKEAGIVTPGEAAEILRGLDTVDALAATDASLRSYLSYEAALIRAVGPVAGRLHTGRSRNDLANTVNRMFYRDQANRIVEALLGLREALAAKAADHLDTVMVVHTHRRQAQPITLAHYLMAICESLGKSVARYEDLYRRLNQSPLGAAASAGTSWPLDRARMAARLGFDGLVVNTVEGVAGWDHIAEFAADNAITSSGLGRLASEIQLWSTDEARTAELDPAFAGTSSIMPQKRNPDSLERTRRIAAEAVGSLTAILTSLNAIEYQHSVVRTPLEPRSLDALVAATHAMTGVVRTLQPDKVRMLRHAAQNFSTMTDLADALVREAGLGFREAHEVVARLVGTAIEEGRSADRIDRAMIEAAARAQLGRPVSLSEAMLRDALDPVRGVARRDRAGGPAPSAVVQTIEVTRREIGAARDRLAAQRERLAAASRTLDEAVAAAR